MTQSLKHCDECGKPFRAPRFAPHKRFCSDKHRMAWHSRQREKAYQLLKAQQELDVETTK